MPSDGPVLLYAQRENSLNMMGDEAAEVVFVSWRWLKKKRVRGENLEVDLMSELAACAKLLRALDQLNLQSGRMGSVTQPANPPRRYWERCKFTHSLQPANTCQLGNCYSLYLPARRTNEAHSAPSACTLPRNRIVGAASVPPRASHRIPTHH